MGKTTMDYSGMRPLVRDSGSGVIKGKTVVYLGTDNKDSFDCSRDQPTASSESQTIGIDRFSLLHDHLASLTDESGEPLPTFFEARRSYRICNMTSLLC
jgi:hypothetical protein